MHQEAAWERDLVLLLINTSNKLAQHLQTGLAQVNIQYC